MTGLLPENIAIVRDTYDIIAEFFSPLLNIGCASDQEINAVNDFITMIEPGRSVVDLGCGLGKHGRYCASKGLSVTGYDISPKMIELAQKHNQNPDFPKMTALLIDNICDFKTSESYDGAICCYTIIHLNFQQAKQALDNLKHCLNEGAIVFLTVYKGTRDGPMDEELAPGHQMYIKDYLDEELKLLLTNSGYDILNLIEWNDKDQITAGDPDLDAPVFGVYARYKREVND